uniref:Uncharacterized protein n=1 Tax=Timema genevievae TaxID=629358 RepID=A0A7R9K368_TIMGE|nr:unnamed protein product [Timema genevievae]
MQTFVRFALYSSSQRYPGRLKHPNIVQLLETFEDKHKVYLIMELQIKAAMAVIEDGSEWLLLSPVNKVREGFGNQINPCRDRGLNPGPSAQKSDTSLDRQVTNIQLNK